MPSYSSQGAAILVASSTAACPCPATVDAGDLLEARIIHNGSAVGAAPAGWTLDASQPVGGGLRGALYTRIADGTEDGTTVNFTGQTGATSGIGYITRIVPTTPGNTLAVASATGWADTNTASTAFTGTGSSWTSTTTHLITHGAVALAPSGSYSASANSLGITQAGATVSMTARFGTRAATNTLWYGYQTATVSSGGTGAPTFSATTVGANGAGVGLFALVSETAPPSNTPPTANAGADQPDVEPLTVVTLDGSGSSDSDGTITTYTWSQVSGTSVTLSGSGATRTFTAPLTADGDTLVFGLVVTDDDAADSSQDTMQVVVLPASEFVRSSGAWSPRVTRIRSGGAWA